MTSTFSLLTVIVFFFPVGLPNAPRKVQVETGPQPGTLLVSWSPVTTQPLPPSRAAVHSYLIYADGRNIAQVPDANCMFYHYFLIRTLWKASGQLGQ